MSDVLIHTAGPSVDLIQRCQHCQTVIVDHRHTQMPIGAAPGFFRPGSLIAIDESSGTRFTRMIDRRMKLSANEIPCDLKGVARA